MDNKHLDEVLPRWQFLKKCLIEQLEECGNLFKGKLPEIFYDCAEMIKEIEETKTAESFKQVLINVCVSISLIIRDFYNGIYEVNITDKYRLESLFNIATSFQRNAGDFNKKTIMK